MNHSPNSVRRSPRLRHWHPFINFYFSHVSPISIILCWHALLEDIHLSLLDTRSNTLSLVTTEGTDWQPKRYWCIISYGVFIWRTYAIIQVFVRIFVKMKKMANGNVDTRSEKLKCTISMLILWNNNKYLWLLSYKLYLHCKDTMRKNEIVGKKSSVSKQMISMPGSI